MSFEKKGKSSSRIENAKRNALVSTGTKAASFFMAFIARTFFIWILGAEYLGINSLYTNILSLLSLADLGMSNVLMFELYKAIKEDDEKLVASLSATFKWIYTIIAVAVLGIGLLLIPVLHLIIHSTLNYSELVIYYVLFLINSSCSYLVVYRSVVIDADQKMWITNICRTGTVFVMYLAQTIYLWFTHDFFGYLVIQIISTVLGNVVINVIALKMYPFLKEKRLIDKSLVNKKRLFSNIKASFLIRASSVSITQISSIVISTIINTAAVGFYTNYYMLVSYLSGVIWGVYSSITASLGDLIAEKNYERAYEVFRENLLIFSLFAAFCCTCFFAVVQDFIVVWIGSEYLLSVGFVLALLAVFYIQNILNVTYMFRSAMGLFKELQYISVVGALLNVALSIAFCTWFGLTGIPVATFVALLLTNFWYEGKVIFKELGKPVKVYFLLQLRYALSTAISMLCAYGICLQINLTGIVAIVLKLIIAIIIFLVVEYVINGKIKEWKYVTNIIKSMFQHKHGN